MNNIRERMLKETYGYSGVNFWENYILSELTRSFSRDSKVFGIEECIDMYSILFGSETKSLFEEMSSQKQYLNEMEKIDGLLFEGYLTEEVPYLTTGEGGFSPTKVKRGLVGFLSGIWNKAKEFGLSIFNKIKPAIASGVSWVKNLLKKGVSAVASSPVLQVALPVLAIAGSIAAAKKIINGIRRKAQKRTLTQKEEEALESIAKKNKEKLNKMRKQIDKKPQEW
jgi:hypothetical protein